MHTSLEPVTRTSNDSNDLLTAIKKVIIKRYCISYDTFGKQINAFVLHMNDRIFIEQTLTFLEVK